MALEAKIWVCFELKTTQNDRMDVTVEMRPPGLKSEMVILYEDFSKTKKNAKFSGKKSKNGQKSKNPGTPILFSTVL